MGAAGSGAERDAGSAPRRRVGGSVDVVGEPGGRGLGAVVERGYAFVECAGDELGHAFAGARADLRELSHSSPLAVRCGDIIPASRNGGCLRASRSSDRRCAGRREGRLARRGVAGHGVVALGAAGANGGACDACRAVEGHGAVDRVDASRFARGVASPSRAELAGAVGAPVALAGSGAASR